MTDQACKADIIPSDSGDTKTLIDVLNPEFHSSNNKFGGHEDEYIPSFFTPSVYCTIDELGEAVKTEHKSRNFKVLSLNIRSLSGKFSQLQAMMHQLKLVNISLDALCIQESWLAEGDYYQNLNLDDYCMINSPKWLSEHGGLVIYLKKISSYKTLDVKRLDTAINY